MLIKQASGPVETLLAFPFIATLDQYYPKIGDWLVNSVAANSQDSIVLLAQDHGQTVGVCMGKTGVETKLRCIRVHPSYQNTGLGLKLIESMFDQLQCSTPHCTVAEELLHQYSRIFINRYGFKLQHVHKGLYRPGKLEYCFN